MALDCTRDEIKNNKLKKANRYNLDKELVKTLQNLLNSALKTNLKPDGDLGPVTHNTIVSFQKKYGLLQDGVVGPVTCKKINDVTTASKTTNTTNSSSAVALFDCPNTSLESGAKGDDVKRLQTMLKALGYYTSVNGKTLQIDGDFGPYTKAAVVAFQKATGHDPDGWFGSKTCPDLNKLYSEKIGGINASAKTTTKKEEIKEIVIDADKYNIIPSTDANLTIEGLNFIIAEFTDNNSFKTGEWGYLEMLNGSNYPYKGHPQPRSYEVVVPVTIPEYKKLKPALTLINEKICTVKSSIVESSKYMVSIIREQATGGWYQLRMTLIESI